MSQFKEFDLNSLETPLQDLEMAVKEEFLSFATSWEQEERVDLPYSRFTGNIPETIETYLRHYRFIHYLVNNTPSLRPFLLKTDNIIDFLTFHNERVKNILESARNLELSNEKISLRYSPQTGYASWRPQYLGPYDNPSKLQVFLEQPKMYKREFNMIICLCKIPEAKLLSAAWEQIHI